jgi:GNAT superfamily N-acetyltransferase
VSTTFVLPRLHSHGIGQAVCAALYRWVREDTRAPCLYTDHATSNPAASRFWPAQGFRPLRYVLLRRWHRTEGGPT